MAKLESLIVDLQVNTAALQSGLDKANAQIEGLDKNLKELAGIITFEKFAKMAGAALQSLAQFTMQGAEAIDKMGKLAQAAGVSVESFSRLAYAGELSGVGVESLGAALVKLDGNMSKALAGGKEQAALFQALGIKITDSAGKMRGADAVMGDLAERFSGMADGAAKTKLAVDVFGKAGAEMIPMLNAGREGLAAMADEADRFGLTVTGEAAANAEAFNDNLDKLKMAATAVGMRVAANLTPALASFTDELLNSAEGAELLKDATWILTGVLKTLLSLGVILAKIFEVAGKTIARVASAVLDAAHGDFDAAKNLIGDVQADVVKGAAETKGAIEKIFSDTEKPASAARKTFGKTAEQIVKDTEAMKKAATESEAAFKALEKVALGYEAQVDGFGAGPLEELEGKLNSGELAKQLEALGDKAEEMRNRILGAASALQALKDAKLANELDFNRERDNAKLSRQLSDRRADFAGINASPLERAQAQTKGFKSFDDALTKLAMETDAQARKLAEADRFKAAGDIASAQAALLAADEHARAAFLAGKAADGFEQVAKSTEKQLVSMAGVLSKLSNVGEHGAEVANLVQTAMQGFQAGGIWGALIAVIANLFTKLEAVGEFIDNAFGQFMEVFSQLNDSFTILFESLTGSLVPVMKALGIAFKAVNDILAPLFQAAAQMMEPFAQLATGFLELVESTGILDFVIKFVAGIFNVIGLVIGGIVLGIQYLWDGILKVVRGIIAFFTMGAGTKEIDETIKKHEAAIEKNKAAMEAAAANIGADRSSSSSTTGSAEIKTTGNVTATGPVTTTGNVEIKDFDLTKYLGGGTMDVYDVGGTAYAAGSVAGAEAVWRIVEAGALMNGATSDEAIALAEAAYADFMNLGESADAAAKSLATFSQSLTNVPEGFRYAAAAFNAQDVDGRGVFQGAGGGDTIIIEGSVISGEELFNILDEHSRRKQYRQTGTGSGWADNIR